MKNINVKKYMFLLALILKSDIDILTFVFILHKVNL